jgi:hypothetical protein
MSDSEKLFVPGDLLIIRYASLASDPSTRLEVAAAIGRLLERADQSYSLVSLTLSPASAQALRAWLASEEAGHFWYLEDNVVAVRQPCEKHVLVGTHQLLRDLAMLMSTPRPPQLAELDLIWQAAAYLIEQNCEE